MSIHEQLPRQVRSELKQVAWSKAAELAKVARQEREHFKCADWLHKAESMPHQQFKRKSGEVSDRIERRLRADLLQTLL